MILGISHIVLRSYDLTVDERFFYEMGYSIFFVEKELATSPSKFRFMRSKSESQDMVFLDKPNVISVELINYGDESPPSYGSLYLVIPGEPPIGSTLVGTNEYSDFSWVWAQLMSKRSPDFFYVPQYRTTLCFSKELSNNNREKCILCHFVSDFSSALTFWSEGVGFTIDILKITPSGKKCSLLSFQRPISQWNAKLLLIESNSINKSFYIDDAGFRCLSLLCSDIEGDSFKIEKLGRTQSSDIMKYTVNQKNLTVKIIKYDLNKFFIELIKIN
jgi:hypothetical protein